MNLLRVDFDFGDLASTETAELLGATLRAEFSFPTVGPTGATGPMGPQGPAGAVSGTLAWTNVTGKPDGFPPSAHTHIAADVTDFAAAVAAVSPPVDWNSLTGKPATFDPSAHTHPISDVTNLQTALDGKAASSHTHSPSEVGLGNVSNTAQVTSVTGTAPIVSSGGTNPAISITAATTSAAGSMSAADKLKLDGIAAGAEVNVNADWDALSGDAQILNKPASFTPSAHSSTHHTGGADAIAPNQISAAWALETRSHSFNTTSAYTLAQGRNVQLNVSSVASNATGTITLPRLTTDSAQNGDDLLIVLANNPSTGGSLVIQRYIWTGSNYLGSTEVVVTATTAGAWRFRLLSGAWTLQPVVSHTHPSTQITGLGTAATQDSTAFAPATGISPSAITGTAVVDSDARLSDSRSPTAHKNSHSIGQADFLAPIDIGAQSLFETIAVTATADTTLTASRAAKYNIANLSGTATNITLPTSGVQDGDIALINATLLTLNSSLIIRRFNSGGGGTHTTLATITKTIGNGGELHRFVYQGSWALDVVTNHGSRHSASGGDPLSLAASQITSGTLAHEHGGLEADVSAYNGLVKISGGSTSAVGIGTGSTEVAAGDHGHGNINSSGQLGSTAGLPVVTTTAGAVTTLALGTAGQVLAVNSGATGVEFAAAAASGVSAVNSTLADILSVSGSDLVADDGGTINSQNPSIQWDDANGKLIYADPFIRAAGAMQIGRSGGNTRGVDSVNIQPDRNASDQVASGDRSVAVGDNTRAANTGCVAIGNWATATGSESIAIGASFAATFGAATASGTQSIAMGRDATASGQNAVALGYNSQATGQESFACCDGTASGTLSFAAGNVTASLRGQFAAIPFNAVYWRGQTTTNAATILNLDATATNRFTIAANTALAVDILLVARRSDTADKWLVARRFLGIRRDGSNNTSLIGAVQTLGTDQSAGSPTWSFALTADDTNECLQLEVTGANSETVQWRATAFYRVA